MNREIKFRAWVSNEDGSKHLMLNVTNISFMTDSSGKYLEECEGWHGINNRIRFSLDNAELLQFTGFRDKNGNEIYVGDIVDSEWIDPNNGYTTRMKQKISDIGISNGYWEIYNPEETASVIGNIYENPELLK